MHLSEQLHNPNLCVPPFRKTLRFGSKLLRFCFCGGTMIRAVHWLGEWINTEHWQPVPARLKGLAALLIYLDCSAVDAESTDVLTPALNRAPGRCFVRIVDGFLAITVCSSVQIEILVTDGHKNWNLLLPGHLHWNVPHGWMGKLLFLSLLSSYFGGPQSLWETFSFKEICNACAAVDNTWHCLSALSVCMK